MGELLLNGKLEIYIQHQAATIFYYNLNDPSQKNPVVNSKYVTKKSPGRGVKRLDKKIFRGPPSHVQLWVFSKLGKIRLDNRRHLLYTSKHGVNIFTEKYF